MVLVVAEENPPANTDGQVEKTAFFGRIGISSCVETGSPRSTIFDFNLDSGMIMQVGPPIFFYFPPVGSGESVRDKETTTVREYKS